MHVEMMTRTWKSIYYKYLVCPMGFYHSLKDSPCSSEWIDACYKLVFKNKYLEFFTSASYAFKAADIDSAL